MLRGLFNKKVDTRDTSFLVAFEKYEELQRLQQEEQAMVSRTDDEWNGQALEVSNSSQKFLAGLGLDPNDLDKSLIPEAKNMFPMYAKKIDRALMGKDIDGQSLKKNQLEGMRSDIEDAKTEIKSWAEYMGVKPERLIDACEKHYNEKVARKKARAAQFGKSS
jgi:hypothetical protein